MFDFGVFLNKKKDGNILIYLDYKSVNKFP